MAVQAESFRKLSVNEGLVLVAAPPSELDRLFRKGAGALAQVIEDAGIKAD
jgi:hypothetical protein